MAKKFPQKKSFPAVEGGELLGADGEVQEVVGENEKFMTFGDHFKELLKMFRIVLFFLIIGVVVSFAFGEQILDFLKEPLIKMDIDIPLYYFKPQDKLVTYFKVAGFLGIVLVAPIIVVQLSRFIAPALSKEEKRSMLTVDFIIPILFVSGSVLSYLFLAPTAMNFLYRFNSGDGVEALWGIAEYINLLFALIGAIGLVFLTPVILLFLVRINILNVEKLVKGRKIAIVISFIFGALLTPPDVVSQVIVGSTLIILYQVTIWIAKRREKRKKRKEEKLKAKESATA